MASDIEQMSDVGYAFKTTVLPLVRDSFGSIDAPVDIAATVGLSVVTAGVGGSVPVAKNLAATLDWRRQQGQKNVNAFDGNQVSAGLKYSF